MDIMPAPTLARNWCLVREREGRLLWRQLAFVGRGRDRFFPSVQTKWQVACGVRVLFAGVVSELFPSLTASTYPRWVCVCARCVCPSQAGASISEESAPQAQSPVEGVENGRHEYGE